MNTSIYYCPTCMYISNIDLSHAFYECPRCGRVSIRTFKDKVETIATPSYEDVMNKRSFYNIAKNLKDIKYSQIYENPKPSLIELIINGRFEELKSLSSICNETDLFTAKIFCDCAFIYSLRYANINLKEKASYLLEKLCSISTYHICTIIIKQDFNILRRADLLETHIATFRLYFFLTAFINRGYSIESALNSHEFKIYKYYLLRNNPEYKAVETDPIVHLCRLFDINIRMGVEDWL